MKDKEFLENLLEKAEEKAKLSQCENNNFLEMENKYLRDLRDLNDSFDEYKRQVEKHVAQLNEEKR